jgi:hypothetical protein
VEWLKKLVGGSPEAKPGKAARATQSAVAGVRMRASITTLSTSAFRLPTCLQPEPCGFMKEATADSRLFVTRDPRAAAERLPLHRRAAAK